MELRNNGKQKGIFITATDTEAGKTVATVVLATLLREKGHDVGVMKPVQCGGTDSRFLKDKLKLKDSLRDINPYYSRTSASPHVAFPRAKKTVSSAGIIKAFHKLRDRHEIVLVEGAGGINAPLAKNYLMSDLIRDLGLDVVIVARLGLGTINHTLLTIKEARNNGIGVRGVLFNNEKNAKGLPETTNPQAVHEIGNVNVLGTIPKLRRFTRKEILSRCEAKVDVGALVRGEGGIRTRDAKKLAAGDKRYVWHPFTQMRDWVKEEPLVIDRAEGSYLIDTRGNRYLDGVSSLWVNVHGHRNPVIDKRIREQINRLSHSTLLGLSNTPAVELAEKLVKIAPKGFSKVFYSDNGSTAVEIGIKMAYQYWQNIGKKKKTNIVHLANSYHGDTLGSVSVGGIDLFHKVYRKLIFKTIQLDFPDCYRAPRGKRYPDYAFEHLERFERLLKRRHTTIACLVLEPIVQGAAGMIVWPEGVLREFARLCRKYDILLVADEVATGFGRTGKMFACQHEGVSPDILCLAKGISGGYLPLAATLTNRRVYEGFLHNYEDQKTFFHGHTYTGNPLCCAAGLANLEVFEKTRTLEKLRPKIKYLQKTLPMLYNLEHVGDVRQRGFMVGIELVADKATKKPYPWKERAGVRVCEEVRNYGVVLRPIGNVVILMPPLSMSMDELDYLLKATYKAIHKVTET